MDGSFVYGVRSTRIYCRPSCPARRPRRDQVVFFPDPQAAENAGFRACRRCLPQNARHPHLELVDRVCRYIETNLDTRLTLAALARDAGLSPAHLLRTFKSVLGVTPRQYAEARRLARWKAGLKNGQTVTASLYDAGYGSSSRLYEKASAQLGMTPATYGKGGRGMVIRYSITDSALGRLLVAATGKGVCAVSMGDSDSHLVRSLRAEYPHAEIRSEPSALGRWTKTLLNHLSGERRRLDLPLDLQATAFQLRVWDALRSIACGETRTYSDLARMAGRPKAARAVARACATNPVAIVVPCHRVVRSDGGLGGYRWGLDRKRRLLEAERRPSDGSRR